MENHVRQMSILRSRSVLLLLMCVNVSLVVLNGMMAHGSVSSVGETVPDDPGLLRALRRSVQDQDATIATLTKQKQLLESSVAAAAAKVKVCPTMGPSPPTPTMGPSPPTPWLIIGIPSVPRRDGSDYLSTVLTSIHKQMLGGVFADGRVRVVVMNNRPGAHPVFTAAQKTFSTLNANIEFVENTQSYADTPVPTRAEFAESDKERPDDPVRQQTLDVAALLIYVQGKSQYFLFYEDDFVLCENALIALDYMTRKANNYLGVGGWTGIRCSFGLNGIVLHNLTPYNDVAEFQTYLLEHFSRRPPDHLAVEWYAKESEQSKKYFGPNRHVMAFRYNIALHIGKVSTLRAAQPWSFPGCFHELIAPQVFPVEAWNPVDCPDDDMWPCSSKNAGKSYLVWNSSSVARVSANRIIYLDKGQVMDNREKKP